MTGLDALNWVSIVPQGYVAETKKLLTGIIQVASNASSVEGDPVAGLVVGGVSSGGNVANAVVYLNRDCAPPVHVTGQFLNVPNPIGPISPPSGTGKVQGKL